MIRSEPESESAKRTAQKADFQWVIRVVNSAHDLAALLFNRARSSVLVLWSRNGSSVIKKSCANFFDLGFVPVKELLYCASQYAHGDFSVR